ncbi:MAG: hypothetical protein Q8L98_04530 [Chlamydiales bacterium]|nr:hypothetical protein [Chlamydiales bacterium]
MSDPTPSPDRIDPSKSIEPKTSVRSQPGTEFQSFMQSSNNASPMAPAPNQAPSPAEIMRPMQQNTNPTFNTLLTQATNLQDSLGGIQDQLGTPKLKLNRSQTRLLKNKFSNANEYIEKAAGKLGAETPPERSSSKKGTGVMGRLMAYIDNGQDKLLGVQKKLDELMNSGKEISPAQMMLVQIKMGQAQQEIEYSSVMLSKVVDALKQLFNIQL